MSTAELLQRRDRFLGKNSTLFYNDPVHLVRGEGVWLFDPNGRRYLDLYNNVLCVGHAHPRVVNALHEQAATLNVHSRYLHEGIVDFAERLGQLHDQPLSFVFACSGTEANEIAMKMARIVTKGRGFICTDAAYHGNSSEVGKLSRISQRGVDEINTIPFPQHYRPIEAGLSDAQLCERYLAEVTAAIVDFQHRNIPLAGMLVCPLLANEGLPNIPHGFMAEAAERVRAAGGLFIVDEVQAGYCRSGSWWGYQVMGIKPDIVTMGKPMGNGLPLAACASSPERVSEFRAKTRYFNTFAASPLQAAVGMAVLDVIKDEGLQTRVTEVGAYLKQACENLARGCEHIGDVRGHGLFIGLEWVKAKNDPQPDRDGAVRVVNALKDKGFLISNAGAFGNVLKIRPPLVFERQHADLFLDALSATVRDIH